MFGNPETTTGGNALKFYSSMRLDIRRVSALKEGDEVIGSRTRVKVVKNKMAPPFKQVEFDILFGEGISMEGDVIDLAQQHGVLDKSGSWFSFEGEKLGQGRDNTRLFLKQHPEITDKIRTKILAKVGKPVAVPPPALAASLADDEADLDEPNKIGPESPLKDKSPRAPGVRGNFKKSE
jgi:recombination protein RecA